MVSLSCLTLVYTLHLPLLLLPLPVMGVVNRVQLLEELVTEETHLKQQSHNHRQPKSLTTISTVKVLDFGADNDMLPDAEGEYTSASAQGPKEELQFLLHHMFVLHGGVISMVLFVCN